MIEPNSKRETTVAEEKVEGIRRDAKRSDGFLEVTTEGLAFHDVLGADTIRDSRICGDHDWIQGSWVPTA